MTRQRTDTKHTRDLTQLDPETPLSPSPPADVAMLLRRSDRLLQSPAEGDLAIVDDTYDQIGWLLDSGDPATRLTVARYVLSRAEV